MRAQPERGATLILALFVLLIFLGLTVAMLYDARSQSTLNGGLKLNRMYNTAADSAIERFRANLSDNYLAPDSYTTAGQESGAFRFGAYLSDGTHDSEYGLLVEDDVMSVNAGMLSLDYKIYVKNNADDLANTFQGLRTGPADEDVIDQNWDFDGRIVVTVEIFRTGETIPVSTKTALIGPTGLEEVERFADAQQETGASAENTGSESGLADLTEIKAAFP